MVETTKFTFKLLFQILKFRLQKHCFNLFVDLVFNACKKIYKLTSYLIKFQTKKYVHLFLNSFLVYFPIAFLCDILAVNRFYSAKDANWSKHRLPNF